MAGGVLRLLHRRVCGWLWCGQGPAGHVGTGEFSGPCALALVPGLGLVVREDSGMRLQFFAPP